MEEKEQKKEVVLDNSKYKERFQFLLSVNDNIICQRYFKVNGFNEYSLGSLELKETLDSIVDEIKADLVSKSRILLWYTVPSPIKLTGFTNPDEATYVSYDKDVALTSVYDDDEKLEPYEVTFKFSFMVDDYTIYERIWDGTCYPKYIRNSVDITNSDVRYKDKEVTMMPFNVAIARHLTFERKDIVYHLINRLCNVMSNSFMDKYGYYTEAVKYGKKSYYYSLHNRNYVFSAKDNKTNNNYGSEEYYYSIYERKFINGWDNFLKDKTNQYYANRLPSIKQCERTYEAYEKFATMHSV